MPKYKGYTFTVSPRIVTAYNMITGEEKDEL